MKLYLSARFTRQQELRNHIPLFEEQGHTVVSRWLNEEGGVSAAPKGIVDTATFKHWADVASRDYLDMRSCDALIHFSEPAGSANVGGGRNAEFGMALAWDKPIIVVGQREHVFHYMPIETNMVRHVADVSEACDALDNLIDNRGGVENHA